MPAITIDAEAAADTPRSSTAYAQTLLLNTWPTCFDNTAWSADAVIAVALDDFIELLIPKIDFRFLTSAASPLNQAHLNNSNSASRTADRVSARAPSSYGGSSASARATLKLELENWTRVRVQINSFQVAEWPYVEPQLFEDFDIGEEQSNGTVQKLEWSEEGLARNGRCALGILTSNGLLSVWAAEDKLGEVEERGWNRKLIVNDSLREWFTKDAYGDTSHTQEVPGRPSWVAKQASILHKRSRIRTFCWSACPCYVANVAGELIAQAQSDYKDHLLIVTNDYEEIIVLRVHSPYSNPSLSEWNTEVLGVVDTNRNRESQVSEPADHNLKTGLHTVATSPWSPCVGEAGASTVALSYAKNIDLEILDLKMTYTNGAVTLETDQDQVSREGGCDPVGPLQWLPKHNEQNHSELFHFPRGQICLQSFRQHSSTSSTPRKVQSSPKITHERDEWSTVTGMAVTVGKDGSQCLHYTPFMPSSSMPAQSLLRSPYGAINLTQSTWATSMQDLRRSFSEDYKLFDHVATRCWGMTAAPNRRHVATCLTLHPSDMVQYATNVQQDVYLAITDEMDHVVPTAGQDVTSEMNMFGLYTWLWSHERYQDEPNIDRGRLRDELQKVNADSRQRLASSVEHLAELIRNAMTLGEVVLALRAAFKQLRNLAGLFLDCLENMIAHGSFRQITNRNDANAELIMFTLITALAARIPRHTEFDTRLLKVYARAAQRVVNGYADDRNDTMNEETSNDDTELTEVCEICTARIEFDDVHSARCQRGHQFARCALTKLAIQEPGISKFCGICNAQYLADDVLQQHAMTKDATMDQDMDERPSTLETATLLQVLSMALQRCLYCGGKFVG